MNFHSNLEIILEHYLIKNRLTKPINAQKFMPLTKYNTYL